MLKLKQHSGGNLIVPLAEVFYSITSVLWDKTQTDSTMFIGTGIFPIFYSALLRMMG